MFFTDIFIKRPVFATTVSLIILLVGLGSYFMLPVRQFPKIDASVITVNTTYPGANADLIEGFVTTPMENAIAGADGIDYMRSSSTQNSSAITVQMNLDYDIDRALTNISNEVQSVMWEMPKDIYDPVVAKNDPNAEPIMWISFQSNAISAEALTDYLIRVVQPQLQMQNGVGQAMIVGSQEYAMRIWLDPYLMAAHKVTASDIKMALNANNVQAAAGKLKGNLQQYTVYSSTDLRTPEEFNNLIIRNENGVIVRIKDIGQAELGSNNENFSVYMKGQKAIFVAIVPKSTANPLDVAKEINKILPQIRDHLPTGIDFSILYDASQFISASLIEVRDTIFTACIFVFLVIFLMIGSFRAVIVPIVTIPLSLVGVCAFMLAVNYTINTLTLLAFVLAIGLVVDDAIVVLENIHRHLAEGKSAFDAALEGAREIAFAVIAMTLTLAAVYAPVGFVTGLTGTLFSEFAFTLAGTVMFSGFIALTLSPMMCSKLYKGETNLNAGFAGLVNKFFDKLILGYKTFLDKVLKAWYLIIIIALIIYGSCYLLYIHLPAELAPNEDQGVVMGIVQAPAAANLDYTEKQTQILENIFKTMPDVINYGVVNGYPNGVNSAFTLILLSPWDQRKITAMEVDNQLMQEMWAIPGILAFPSVPPPLPGTSGYTPISFVLKTTNSYDYLNTESEKFKVALEKAGFLMNIQSDLRIDQPQTVVDVKRNEAGVLGINMDDVATSLNIFLSEPITTWFEMNGRSYQVIPRLFDRFRKTPGALDNLELRTQSGKLIPLSNIVNVTEQVIPESLNHFQQLRSATLTANLAPGITMGNALEKMNEIAKQILPKDIQVDYADQSRQYYQSEGKMGPVFMFAIIFIYLILAAQFESFRDPFIVMLSVPLSIAGALALMLLGGASINIYTQIGLITLVGLITKNGILIVEFANQQQEKGIEFREAILTAASYRLRPILMTTCAMILGALPLVFATGAGSVSRTQIGLVIVGGMSFGTLLTLFVVPTAYYMFATKIHKNPSTNKLEL